MRWISILVAVAIVSTMQTVRNAAFAQKPIIVVDLNEILVRPNGQVSWKGATLSLEQLREKLKQMRELDPSRRVSVRGDYGALYFETTNVEDLVEEIGVAVSTRITRNIIVVKKDGHVVLNGSLVPVGELRERLGQSKSANPSFKIYVLSSPDLSYSDMETVLNIVEELDVIAGVGLAVKPIAH